jgi:site-specific DNA-methyltransferase (adenine-specific)
MTLRVEKVGPATLYLGDCLDVLPEVGFVNLCVMDPPYNFSTASSGKKHEYWADAINSARWFRDVLLAIKPQLSADAAIWQFMNWRTLVTVQKAVWDSGMKIESLMVWDKEWIGPGGSTGLRPAYELVALMTQGAWRVPNRGLPDIWRCQWASQRPNGHPAEKPVALMERIIRESPGETVLDPFMGSGTTGVAAIRNGRSFVGIEINEAHFETALKRIEQAVANEGNPFGDLVAEP